MKKMITAVLLLCAALSAQTPMPDPVDAAVKDGARTAIEEQRPDIDITRVIFMGWEDDGSLTFVFLDKNGEPQKDNIPGVRPAAADPREKQTPARKNQEGRLYFMAHTAAKSLYVFPTSYSSLFHKADERAVTGLVLATFGGSLYGSYRFTKNLSLGYGRVGMMNYGGELAITYANLAGLLAAETIDPDDDPDTSGVYIEDDDQPDPSDYIRAVINLAGFPAGIWAGSKFTPFEGMPYGKVAVMKYGGRSALFWAYLLSSFLYEADVYKTIPDYQVGLTLTGMAFIPAGNYLGYRLAKNRDISSGRSVMIETAGVLGGTTGGLLPLLWEEEDWRVYQLMILAGHVAGSGLGFRYREGTSYRFSQGAFTALSAGAGAAVALSLPFMFQAEDPRPYVIAGITGGWGGFILGERLARTIFEKGGRDAVSPYKVEFPVLYKWPVLALSTLRSGKRTIFSTDIVTVRF